VSGQACGSQSSGAAPPLGPLPAAGAIDRFLRAEVIGRLAGLQRGALELRDALGRHVCGTPGGLTGRVIVTDLSAYTDIATGGTIGAAEAFMQGKWHSEDLTTIVRLFVADRAVMERVEGGLAALGAPLLRLAHWQRRNTRRQSRRNIGAHYDLGNEFYGLFLDPTMSYSAVIYPHAEATLAEAAVHKLDVVCRKLGLRPTDHLLEIGTGWGGLALHAAREYGCRVTTTTISREQRRYAEAQVAAAGLGDRIAVLDRDYRDLEGRYDKLVSIEMVEAVGLDHLDGYFRACSERLRPGGRFLLQGIVIADQLYDQARRSVDFIQRYIFPGGALPSVAVMRSALARVTDLQVVGLDDIGLDYARTLRDWRRRFLQELPAVRALGFGEEFIRMWEYYFAYCEGGFLERAISDVQLVCDKPG
jgi:cyclopropane-fatty-acyl-phospholipid synthase